jgi:hypothetical protein
MLSNFFLDTDFKEEKARALALGKFFRAKPNICGQGQEPALERAPLYMLLS